MAQLGGTCIPTDRLIHILIQPQTLMVQNPEIVSRVGYTTIGRLLKPVSRALVILAHACMACCVNRSQIMLCFGHTIKCLCLDCLYFFWQPTIGLNCRRGRFCDRFLGDRSRGWRCRLRGNTGNLCFFSRHWLCRRGRDNRIRLARRRFNFVQQCSDLLRVFRQSGFNGGLII